MVIQGFNQFGGKNAEVGALRKLLNHLDIVAPHNGEPFSEELLFGIGGGIGFGYFLFERTGTHPVFIGTRVHTKETERPELLQTICSRIGVPYYVQNSSSANAAATNLKANFDQERIPIVWVDASRLPYLGLSFTIHSHHAVVVYGTDENSGEVMLSDRCPQPVTLSREDFRAARESSWSPKYRAMIIQPAERASGVKAAVTAGIRDTVDQMTEGLGITNFGLKGMEKWATVLTSSREKKSWLKVFPPGPALFSTLFSIWSQIRLRGDTGSANRTFYAAFLDEAAAILEQPALRDIANAYRQAERMWTDVADAHLPATVPQFEDIRKLALRRKELFETRGMDALDEIVQLKQQVDQLTGQMREQFPLDAAETKSLLSDLRVRILRLREHEAECIRQLDAAVPAPAQPIVAPPRNEPQPEPELANQ